MIKKVYVKDQVYCDICHCLCKGEADYFNSYLNISHYDWRREGVSAWRNIVWLLKNLYSREVFLWWILFWEPKMIDVCEGCAEAFRKCYNECIKKIEN